MHTQRRSRREVRLASERRVFVKIETTDKLRTRAARITPDMWASLPEVITDMFDIMRKSNGVGLAAPQVGIGYQLAVIDTGAPGERLVLINPTIAKSNGRRIMTEGCLSLPGEAHVVVRHRAIEVWYTDLDGKAQRLHARKSYLGQVIEHEIDHLQGVLIDGKKTQ